MQNVRYAPGSQPLETEPVRRAVAEAERRLGPGGRLLIRKSGTEPLVRVMGEAEDEALLADVVGQVAAEIGRAG